MEICSDYGKGDAAQFMDGLSLHYYTFATDSLADKGSATKFSEEVYYKTLKNTFYMEKLIENHSAIMDSYDAEKKIGLIIDEWGAWYNVEDGTVPGFLYQQNTMRDAMVAAINLNLFNKHSDRVKMANMAQMVNVVQSVILTEGAKMILTPTYYVFKLFRDHQENILLDSVLEETVIGTEENRIPQISESVSEDEEGRVHITLANLSAREEAVLEISLLGKEIQNVSGEMVVNDIHAHNTFEEPEKVVIQNVKDIMFTKDKLVVNMSPCCVMHLEVE